MSKMAGMPGCAPACAISPTSGSAIVGASSCYLKGRRAIGVNHVTREMSRMRDEFLNESLCLDLNQVRQIVTA